MPLITENDIDRIKDLLLRGTSQTEIGKHYGCNAKTVSRFIEKYNLTVYNNISQSQLVLKVNELQQDECQTHGRGIIVAKLAAQGSMVIHYLM